MYSNSLLFQSEILFVITTNEFFFFVNEIHDVIAAITKYKWQNNETVWAR